MGFQETNSADAQSSSCCCWHLFGGNSKESFSEARISNGTTRGGTKRSKSTKTSSKKKEWFELSTGSWNLQGSETYGWKGESGWNPALIYFILVYNSIIRPHI